MTTLVGSILFTEIRMITAKNEEDFELYRRQLLDLVRMMEFEWVREKDPLFFLDLIELPEDKKILDIERWV